MHISEFRRVMLDYEKRARDRKPERLDAGLADTPWNIQVIEELCMDLIARNNKLAADVDELNSIISPAEPAKSLTK